MELSDDTITKIKKALESLYGQWKVLQYSCGEDFKAMWELEEKGESLGNEEKFVILWDKFPDKSGNGFMPLKNYLTPIDWALAYAYKRCGTGQGNGLKTNGLKIKILDVSSCSLSDFHRDALPKMNWVEFYSFNKNSNANSPLGLRETKEWRNSENAEQQIQPLVDSWRSFLRKTAEEGNSHHSINNILGPMFLLQKEKDTPHQEQAFRQLIEWLGIVKVELANIRKGEGKDFDILAIDDKLYCGWARVLQKIFGIESKKEESYKDAHFERFVSSESNNEHVSFWGTSDPKNLIKLLSDKDAYGERIFDSPIMSGTTKSDIQKPYFLVLDLHLYSDKEEENEFFGKCLDIVESINDVKNLAWEGFDSKKIAKLRSWLDNNGDEERENTEEYEDALSLFPRLCALRWPSVPIFVFSVTGKRNLMAKFSKYRNIFPAYSKPNFLEGNADQQIEAFNHYWEKEFLAAKNLIEVQRNLIELSKWSLDNDNQGRSGAKNKSGHRHVVIALDESGDDSEITHIGGVILVSRGDNATIARENSCKFQEAVYKKNTYYIPPGRSYSQMKKPKEKRRSLDLKDLKKFESSLGFFIMDLDVACRDSDEECLNYVYKDQIYLHGLNNIIHILLAEFLPSAGINLINSGKNPKENKTQICIWLPTKQHPMKDVFQAREEAWRCDLRVQSLDQAKSDDESRIETIGGYGVGYSILNQTLYEREILNEMNSWLEFIKVRKIPYSPEKKDAANQWICLADDCPDKKRVIDRYGKRSHLICAGKKEIPNTITKKICSEETFPDYSVMQHLADQMVHDFTHNKLDSVAGYMKSLDSRYCFRINKKNAIPDFLQCARMFDRAQAKGTELSYSKSCKDDGFKIAYKNGFFLNGVAEKFLIDSNKLEGTGFLPTCFESADIKSRLMREIKDYLEEVDGNILVELARGI